MDTELVRLLAKVTREAIQRSTWCGAAHHIVAALEATLPEPQPERKFKEGDWVHCHCLAPALTNPCQLLGKHCPGTNAWWLHDGRCKGWAIYEKYFELLPPRPRDDQLPPGKVLSGECYYPGPDQQWADSRPPDAPGATWDIFGLGENASKKDFNGRRWIVDDAPAAPEKAEEALRQTITELLRSHGVRSFLLELYHVIDEAQRPDESALRELLHYLARNRDELIPRR